MDRGRASREQAATAARPPARRSRPQRPGPDGAPGRCPRSTCEGLQRLRGNQALYLKLLASFAQQYRPAAEHSPGAGRRGLRRAHGLAHDVKGVAGNLSAQPAGGGRGAGEARQACRRGQPAAEGRTGRGLRGVPGALDRALCGRTSPSCREAARRPRRPPATARRAAELAREPPRACARRGAGGRVRARGPLPMSWPRSPAFAPYRRRSLRLADDFEFDGALRLAEELAK